MHLEIGTDICTLLYIQCIAYKNLLYSTGNSTCYSVMTYMKKNLKKSGYICMCKSKLSANCTVFQ